MVITSTHHNVGVFQQILGKLTAQVDGYVHFLVDLEEHSHALSLYVGTTGGKDAEVTEVNE